MKNYIQQSLSSQTCQKILLKSRTIPKYFTSVQLTLSASTKLLNHSTYGIPKQVMGLLIGFYRQQNGHGVFTVTDVIVLPVQASQTRVTADDQTYNIIAAYTEWLAKVKMHNIVGWYHSHPSYGCWLSGIDVNTQERFQLSSDPFLAIVVDPIKSVNLQKLDISAFRVHPKGYKQQVSLQSSSLSRRKAVDFGVHYQRYYEIPIRFVTSRLGQCFLTTLSKKQWANQLSLSPLSQQQYLLQLSKDQFIQFKQYLQMKQNNKIKQQQLRRKDKQIRNRMVQYQMERNVRMIEIGLKQLLF